MSDDGEIDVESDEVSEMLDSARNQSGKAIGLDKRAHHNALERKRRDHIKDSFTNLRDCIPAMSGEKVSRAHILNKATEYIRQMQRCSATRTVEIDDLRKKNEILEEQIHALEQAKATGSTIDNPEDLIASIAEKVQQRQKMKLQNQPKTTPKLQIDASTVTSEGGKTATTTESTSATLDVTTPSSINVLANNIRTTQNLLNALAKNLPTTTNNPQMRSLATRVLASPLRPAVGTNASILPRGVVTATAVPSTFQTSSSSGLPTTSQTQSQIKNSNTTGVVAPVTMPSTSVTQSLATPITTTGTNTMDTNATLTLLVNSLTAAENSPSGDALLSNTDTSSLVEAVASAVANSSGISQPGNGQGLDVDLLINKIGQQASELVADSNDGLQPPPSKRVKSNSSSDE